MLTQNDTITCRRLVVHKRNTLKNQFVYMWTQWQAFNSIINRKRLSIARLEASAIISVSDLYISQCSPAHFWHIQRNIFQPEYSSIFVCIFVVVSYSIPQRQPKTLMCCFWYSEQWVIYGTHTVHRKYHSVFFFFGQKRLSKSRTQISISDFSAWKTTNLTHFHKKCL